MNSLCISYSHEKCQTQQNIKNPFWFISQTNCQFCRFQIINGAIKYHQKFGAPTHEWLKEEKWPLAPNHGTQSKRYVSTPDGWANHKKSLEDDSICESDPFSSNLAIFAVSPFHYYSSFPILLWEALL